MPRVRRSAAFVIVLLTGCGGLAPTSEAPASSAPPPSASAAAVDPAGPFAAAIPAGVSTIVDQALTEPTTCGTGPCVVPIDIVVPTGSDGVPIVVLLPGGPVPFEGRRYLEDLALALAERGAVVYVSVYRSGATGNAEGDTLEDVRCAIRFARATAADHGGDRDRLVVVGHSYGGDFAMRTALTAEVESPACVTDGNGVPNAVVALAGYPIQLTGAEPVAPPMVLVSGSDDPVADSGEVTAERLRGAGYEAEYVELPGVDHGEVVDPAVAPEVVELILGAVP